MSTPNPSAPRASASTSTAARGADFSSRGASVRAFLGTLAGVGDVPPNDPHRIAKWAAGSASISITGIFIWNMLRGHRAARAEGFRAGRAAARAALPPRVRKR